MIVTPEKAERDLEKRTGRKNRKRSNGVGKEGRGKGEGARRRGKRDPFLFIP